MAAWTKERTAGVVRDWVKWIQSIAGLPTDGRYSQASHDGFKVALRAAGVANVDDIDRDGPQGLLQAFFTDEGLTEKGAEAIQLAWAWWVTERGKLPASLSAAQAWIVEINRKLVAGGNEPLDAKTAEDYFLGDKPKSELRKLAPWLIGSGVVLAAGIGFAVVVSRRRPVALAPAYAGRRW